MIILAANLPDGRVRVAQTCCAWDKPDADGNGGRHGMHVGGHHPHWLQVGDGEWRNLSRRSMLDIRRDWGLFAACAGSVADFLTACGVSDAQP